MQILHAKVLEHLVWSNIAGLQFWGPLARTNFLSVICGPPISETSQFGLLTRPPQDSLNGFSCFFCKGREIVQQKGRGGFRNSSVFSTKDRPRSKACPVVATAAKSRGCGNLRPWSLRASCDFLSVTPKSRSLRPAKRKTLRFRNEMVASLLAASVVTVIWRCDDEAEMVE